MPTATAVKVLNTALIQSQPLVAVFFGVTGGIGHYTVCELAKAEAQSGKGLRVYIIARNAKTAEANLAEYRKLCPTGEFICVKADDLSLIRDVDRVCAEITRLEEKKGADARIDYHMFAQGGSIFLPRFDTSEGLDKTMSLMYYSRMRITLNLLPLLDKSRLPAAVVSVYASGMDGEFFPDDMSLRAPGRFSYALARSHMSYFHARFFEALAAQHPRTLRLVHIFPGIVPGAGYQSPELPGWFRVLANYVLLPLLGPFVAVPADVCGRRMLSLASTHYPPREHAKDTAGASPCVGSDGKPGSGVYCVGTNGESNINAKAYTKFDKDEMRKRVWDHTMEAFSVITAGGTFTN